MQHAINHTPAHTNHTRKHVEPPNLALHYTLLESTACSPNAKPQAKPHALNQAKAKPTKAQGYKIGPNTHALTNPFFSAFLS